MRYLPQLGEVETILDPGPLLNPERIQQRLFLTADGTQCQDQSNGCVPVNLWSDDIGPEAAAFITYPEGQVGNEERAKCSHGNGFWKYWRLSSPGRSGADRVGVWVYI